MYVSIPSKTIKRDFSNFKVTLLTINIFTSFISLLLFVVLVSLKYNTRYLTSWHANGKTFSSMNTCLIITEVLAMLTSSVGLCANFLPKKRHRLLLYITVVVFACAGLLLYIASVGLAVAPLRLLDNIGWCQFLISTITCANKSIAPTQVNACDSAYVWCSNLKVSIIVCLVLFCINTSCNVALTLWISNIFSFEANKVPNERKLLQKQVEERLDYGIRLVVEEKNLKSFENAGRHRHKKGKRRENERMRKQPNTGIPPYLVPMDNPMSPHTLMQPQYQIPGASQFPPPLASNIRT